MDLIILTRQYGYYTGATTATQELVTRFKNNFKNIFVITLKSSVSSNLIDNVTIKECSNLWEMNKVLKSLNNNNILGYSDDHFGFIFHYYNIRYVHTYHGNWPDLRYQGIQYLIKSLILMPMYKKTIRCANFVASVSYYMLKKFVAKLNRNSEVVYNGIKQIGFNHYGERKLKRRTTRFIMVGNIDRRKYKKAINIFHNIGTSKNISVSIYGKKIDKKICKKLEAFPFVFLKGAQDNIDFSKYDCMIITSSSENLPISIVEALIAGIPVLGFNIGGLNEVVFNGENGYLFEFNEIDKFAKNIINFKNQYNVINYNSIYKQFDWDKAAAKYLDKFRKLNLH